MCIIINKYRIKKKFTKIKILRVQEFVTILVKKFCLHFSVLFYFNKKLLFYSK